MRVRDCLEASDLRCVWTSKPLSSTVRSVRILVSTTAGLGHIHPVVPIARSLQSAGHEVLWATSAKACETVSRYGFATTAAGIEIADRLEPFVARYPDVLSLPPRQRRPTFFRGFFAEIHAPAMAAALAPIMDRFKPELVVHETSEFAAAPLARQRGVRHIAVAFSGFQNPEVMAAGVCGIAALWDSLGLNVPPDLGFFDHAYLYPLPDSLCPRPQHANVQPIRALHADGAEAWVAPSWLQRLGNERPLVYATFGTEIGPSAPWTTLLEAVSAVDCDALVTINSQTDPESFGPIPANVRIERYVPQSAVLARAAAVVSHAGAGTAFATVAAGLPQVCVPFGADQFDNADALASSGAALCVDGPDATPQLIAEALAKVFGDNSYRLSADRIATDMAAMPHPDHVATLNTS